MTEYQINLVKYEDKRNKAKLYCLYCRNTNKQTKLSVNRSAHQKGSFRLSLTTIQKVY
jgi:hypothetical protein